MAASSYFGSAVIPLRLIFLMWLAFFVEISTGIPFTAVGGIVSRTLYGIIGIFTAPLLHGSLLHIISNTIPLLFLGSVLFFFYNKIAPAVFLRGYFWTNILVWLFARGFPASHIGASGLVYALAFFLIFFGIFRRDFASIIISIIVLLSYGSVFYGILPSDPQVSWESHFAGALVGISTALTYGKKKNVS
jgi:membrane associated rhomboid family serine protease